MKKGVPHKCVKSRIQMSFMMPAIDHIHAEELDAASRILDRNPIINEMAFNDLTLNVNNTGTGACRMTAEQVVRTVVIKQAEGYSYQGLAFHIIDSTTYRRFCRIGINDKGFGKSALCNNIKALSTETWEAINGVLTGEAKDKGIEEG